MKFSVDPSVVDRMDVGALFQMIARLDQKKGTEAPDSEKFEDMLQKVRDMNLPDVKV